MLMPEGRYNSSCYCNWLKHGISLRNTIVSVVVINTEKDNLEGEKISKLHIITEYSLKTHTCYKGTIKLEKM